LAVIFFENLKAFSVEKENVLNEQLTVVI